jgi:hypothetical protein
VRQFIDQDIVNFAKARLLWPCASLFALKVTLLVHSVVELEPQGARTFGRSRSRYTEVSAPALAPGQTKVVYLIIILIE